MQTVSVACRKTNGIFEIGKKRGEEKKRKHEWNRSESETKCELRTFFVRRVFIIIIANFYALIAPSTFSVCANEAPPFAKQI